MRTIISASRRTDIPGFYIRWLENRTRHGGVEVRNPVVKGQTYFVSLKPEDVHTIVLWSKNFQPFLDSPLSYDNRFRWYFNFSLVDCPEWERNVPPLDKRLRQVREIAQRWSPDHINWRFDPIVFWDEGKRNNLDTFVSIGDIMADIGIRRCTFSFVTWYNKVRRRPDVKQQRFFDPPIHQKCETVSRLNRHAQERGITLESCCNDALLQVEGVKKGSCIQGHLLSQLAGERGSLAKDSSQRSDCGCTKSSDIGAYRMSCLHDCRYCYAKPVSPS